MCIWGLFLCSVFYPQNAVWGVGLPGLEPGTSSLSEKRSNRLSYRPVHGDGIAAGLMYNTEVSLTSGLKTGGAGSKIGTVLEITTASRCERSI